MELHEIDQFFRVEHHPLVHIAVGPCRMVAVEVSGYHQLDPSFRVLGVTSDDRVDRIKGAVHGLRLIQEMRVHQWYIDGTYERIVAFIS